MTFTATTPSGLRVPNLIVAQVLTSPFQIVRIPVTTGTVEFKKGS